MIRLIIAISVLLSASAATSAQVVKVKSQFSSINMAGVGSGENGESVVVQTINGVAKGKWFGGIGVGVDYYQNRTVPVFADVRYELIGKSDALLLYGDIGLNLPWLTSDQKSKRGWPTDYKNGLGYEGGFGLKLKGKNNRAFLVSCGYNFKQVKEIITLTGWGSPNRNETKEYIDNRYRRLILKLGFQI